MYLYAGKNRILRRGRIIGIFDLDAASRGEDTKRYLRQAEKEGKTERASEDLPKSFVLYLGERGESRVLFTPLSAAALKGRPTAAGPRK